MTDSNLNLDDPAEIIKDILMESMSLNNNDHHQLDAISTDHLLKALLLRLLDEREERQTVVTSSEILATTSANISNAAKKKKRAAAAAAKKKRYKRNKAAAKHKKTKIMLSWLGGGIISVIMMIAFSSIETLISDGSGDGEAPPALPPSASRSLRQRGHRSNIDNAASTTSPDIISPLPAAVPPIFSPAAVGHLMNEELSSTCLDTPNWKDKFGEGCDFYYVKDEPGCPDTDEYAGEMGPATLNCCHCGGGSQTLPPTNSPKPTISPTEPCFDTPNWVDSGGDDCYYYVYEDPDACSIADDYAGDMGSATDNCCYCGGGSRTVPPTNSPTASSSPSISSHPTQTCLDTPNWKDRINQGCDIYEKFGAPGCPRADNLAGDMGPATLHCCHCGGGSHTFPPTNSPTISLSPTKFCLDTPNWTDMYGAGCDYYEETDECSIADADAGEMGPATLHCCYCGGGSHTLPPTNSPTASSSPSISSHPTAFCLDTPNWKDKFGDDCYYYAYEDPDACSIADAYAGDMGPATDHCCYCGGGSHTFPPTNSPKPSTSTTTSLNPTEFCLDTPNWRDRYGKRCNFYEESEPACRYADGSVGDMGPATEHCCHCGGGSSVVSQIHSLI